MAKSKDPLTSRSLSKVRKEHKGPFSTVHAARELIKERAKEFVEAYYALAAEATAAGKPEVAEKILWNLIDHTPADADGNRIIESAASKPKEVVGRTGPTIQIGLALGGMDVPKTLPQVTTIDIEPEPKS